MGLREVLALAVAGRLLRYRRFMKCRPDPERLGRLEVPERLVLDPGSLPALGLLMAWGLGLEQRRAGDLVYTPLRKHMSVAEAEAVMGWLSMDEVAVTVPSSLHRELLGCDVAGESVYEVWAPLIPSSLGERLLGRSLSLTVPDRGYVVSYQELLGVLRSVLSGVPAARVYVLSKFAQPGYLGRFLEEFGGVSDIRVFIATESRIPRALREKASGYGNVSIVPTRSHRKLVLVVYRDELGDWSVLGYRGSMNLFSPGVDDYMEAVESPGALQRLIHGLIRAFLVV